MIKTGGFDVILAADAGMEALYRCHVLPDIIVGDFDSVSGETLEYFQNFPEIRVEQAGESNHGKSRPSCC